MKQKFAKNLYIINSLVSFCHHAGATSYSIQFQPDGEITVFEIRATIDDMDPELLNELGEALKLNRSHEIEQDYWELCGETDSWEELTLIGMMLDESSAVYEKNILEIKAIRED